MLATSARGLLAALALAGAGCAAETEAEAPDAAVTTVQRLKNEVVAEHRGRLALRPGRSGILAEQARYSLLDEELIIRDFFADRRDGFFLDVGCAWPIRSSNTYYLEKHLGWTGIGVDALAEYAPDWERERPESRFRNYLATNRSGGTGSFFRSPLTGLSSTHEKLASGYLFGEESMEPEEIQVPEITLDELLRQERVAKIDLLSLDIEGHELEALAGFDLERFQPELVVVEGTRARELSAYFAKRGYRLIDRYLAFDDINRYFARRPDAETRAARAPGP